MFDILVVVLAMALLVFPLALLGGIAAKIIAIFSDDGWRTCSTCKGFGIVPDKDGHERICKACSGLGEFYIPTHQEMG